MKCVLCQRDFPFKLTFGSLPRPPILCPHCQSRHRPDGFLEVIPIWKGTIDYLPLFEREYSDYHLEMLLMNHWEKSLKVAISNHSKYDIYLDLSVHEFRRFQDWQIVLLGCHEVLITSHFRFDFMLYEDSALL